MHVFYIVLAAVFVFVHCTITSLSLMAIKRPVKFTYLLTTDRVYVKAVTDRDNNNNTHTPI